MKRFHAIIQSTLILATSLTMSASVHARDLIVAVSPFVSPVEAKEQAKEVLQFLSALEPGDEALIVDGYHLNTLAKFVIPKKAGYESAKARLGVNRKAVAALLNLGKHRHDPDTAPTTPHALRLPQLLRHVAENIAMDTKLDVLAIGSAFYDDPNDADFSMAGGLIPGDGHLSHSRAHTPFGASDDPSALKNINLHLAYSGEMQSDRHLFAVQRFWALFLEQQSGQLLTFTNDRLTMFHRVKMRAKAPARHFQIVPSDKLEMIRLSTQRLHASIYERPISSEALNDVDIRRAENTVIGISWGCADCDIDLFARAHPGAEILYYGLTHSAEGVFFKDYRSSPEAQHAHESIAFNVPVDLRRLQIAANFYSGNAPDGVSGEIRIAVGDRTYSRAFHIAAHVGKESETIAVNFNTGVVDQPQTVLINPLQVIGAAQP